MPDPQQAGSSGTKDVATAVPAANVPPTEDLPASKPLTAEEQLALYENDLKENDWGHQPC